MDEAVKERLLETSREMLKVIRELREAMTEPPAPDDEIKNWPLWAGDNDYVGGVWCGDESCPLDAENSEIGDFREGNFTLNDLYNAIGEHIAARREKEADLAWDEDPGEERDGPSSTSA